MQRQEITKETYNEHLIKLYSCLSEESKKLFFNAILMRNTELLKEVMAMNNINDADAFIKITDQLFSAAPPTEIVHGVILGALQDVIAKEKSSSIIPLLISTFESIPETSSSNLPGTYIDIRSKLILLSLLVAKKSTAEQAVLISKVNRDISYDPKLPAFRPSLGDGSYVKTRISFEEYKAAVRKHDSKDDDAVQVNISEFIILTIGLLQELGLEKTIKGKSLLTEISNDYLFARYDSCLSKIKKYCGNRIFLAESHPSHPFFKLDSHKKMAFDTILKISTNLIEFNSEENHTRRFFETRLSQYIVGLIHNEQTVIKKQPVKESKDEKHPDDQELHVQALKSINKILKFYLNDAGSVSNIQQLETNMSLFCNGYKDKERFDPKKLEHILHHSRAYNLRDRSSKPSEEGVLERKFELDVKSVGNPVWNSSGGAMSSLSPTFLDSQLSPPVRNMLVDSSCKTPSIKDSKKQWSRQNNREYAAFVGSISGHIGNIVGMLINYMEKFKEDISLSRDINFFFMIIVSIYVKRGFHSILEIMDMLYDESIQKIFKSYGVIVDPEKFFLNDKYFSKHLDYALNDALAHTKTFTMKRNILAEVREHNIPKQIT